MKKSLFISILFLTITAYGCSVNNVNDRNDDQTQDQEIEQQIQDEQPVDEIAVSDKEEVPDIQDNDITRGGTYIYNDDSWVGEIELNFSLKNISPTGATLVFEQRNADAPKGELMYGEDFVIEVKKNDEWEEAPIVIEGNYGFNAIAMMIEAGGIVERELKWEWLYGELEPGEYRIKKSVNDFIESGVFDKYMVYAYFTLN